MCPPAPNADLSGLRRISPYPSRWSIIQNIVNAQPERAGQSGLLPFRPIVLIKGAGDLATGAAVRLQRSGFAVVMTEIERPLAVRRMAAFAQAVFDGSVRIEDVRGVRCTPDEVDTRLAAGDIPILVDPEAQALRLLRPAVLVDAIMAKRNTGTRRDDAPYVIALGPGFRAGEDCHAVIETNRGHYLGRVIRQGGAQPDTGNPGVLPGAAANASRVLRAPVDGFVVPSFEIGDRIEPGQTVAAIQGTNGETAPVVAPFAGILRGLVHPSVPVTAGMKIGDLDPRAERSFCFTVSDKSLAIGGGVLEAILSAVHRSLLPPLMRTAQKPDTN